MQQLYRQRLQNQIIIQTKPVFTGAVWAIIFVVTAPWQQFYLMQPWLYEHHGMALLLMDLKHGKWEGSQQTKLEGLPLLELEVVA